MAREYEKTHPWLTFGLDVSRLDYRMWMLLGEARSKCEHIAGVPLRPNVANELHQIYMAKGAFATTSIEGNTLTEAQVREQLEGRLRLPPSKEYLAQEVDNMFAAFNLIVARCLDHQSEFSPSSVRELNRLVLRDLPLEEDVVPGEFRSHSVVVMRYRGAPAADCEFLMDELCSWLNGAGFRGEDDQRLMLGLLRAILAHLYLAWIHPFGDGNGRTARLIEFQMLLEAGVPTPAAHLLSNHYNATRAEYYRQLDYASKSGGDVLPFLEYAVRGFVEGLREQLEVIRYQQWDIAWRDFIFRAFKEQELSSAPDERRRELALALSSEPTPLSRLWTLSPGLARVYASKSEKTIQRDLEALMKLELAARTPQGYIANRDKILQFLPLRREN